MYRRINADLNDPLAKKFKIYEMLALTHHNNVTEVDEVIIQTIEDEYENRMNNQ